MTASLAGRVVVVTGAGHGLGRSHALGLAAEGASVVVNDLGTSRDGRGNGTGAAGDVVAEIVAAGGIAVADTHDISTREGADGLIDRALEAFGAVHAVVNNAGILRDAPLLQLSDDDWDAVQSVHLRGTFLVSRAAGRFWSTAPGLEPRLVNTASGSGLMGGPRQASYAAAKAGVVALTMVCARELAKHGVLSNAIAPVARTRATLGVPALAAALGEPCDGFDPADPTNVSPVVAYLCSSRCALNGALLQVAGKEVGLFRGWTLGPRLTADGRWTPAELAAAVDAADWAGAPRDLVSVEVTLEELLEGALA